MSTPPQHWQAHIYLDPQPDEPPSQVAAVVVFGATLALLRTHARAWLLTQQPPTFATSDIDTATTRRRIYFSSDGQRRPLSVEPVGWQPPHEESQQLSAGMALVSGSPLDAGWYLDIPMRGGQPTWLGDIHRAIADFLEHIIIVPGPEHINRALLPEPMALSQVRGLWRATNELQARDLVQQGWKLMVIELTDHTDRAMRQPVYVLAHDDSNALTTFLSHS